MCDEQCQGKYLYVFILDCVFVEMVGGDLIIKIEDNIDDGQGIYCELVEYFDQIFDDVEFFYVDLGNFIVLCVCLYQEEDCYFVYNEKI